MKPTNLSRALVLLVFLVGAIFVSAQKVEERNVRAHMEFLASDAMQGRGSGTQFELLTGKYLASQMQQMGIEPAGDKSANGVPGYIQTIKTTRNSFSETPNLSFGDSVLTHGKEMIVFSMSAAKVSGRFEKIAVGQNPSKGAVAFVAQKDASRKLGYLMESSAAAILIEETQDWRTGWDRFTNRKITFLTGGGSTSGPALIVLSTESAKEISKLEEGTPIEIAGKLGKPQTQTTWNAVGMIKGRAQKRSSEAILLSAHMDHVGVRQHARGEDKIYNGADDDASGCVAVLELARVIASGKRPKRSVYFAFYGSEEVGGRGSRYFANNLPFPKERLVANLQFEMIGRPDPKVAANELWLTGYDRSNLGVELAKHGGNIVADPHPKQNFFRRSDNYALAREGIIAHTVSSFGLHKDYHQPSDEIETINFEHMTRAINSMIKPVRWLVNSKFKPSWYEGKRP